MELARAEYDGPAPAEETTLDRTEQPDGTFLVKVQTVDELLAAIAPNTTILRWRIIMFLRERASRVKAVLLG